MDPNKLKKIFQELLDISYSGLTIEEFRVHPTQKYDENLSKWVPDSFCVFTVLRKKENVESESWTVLDEERNIHLFFESLLGYEFCLDVI